ncbi:MAG: BCCT family transporter, partial [Pseudomonadota bacterium]
DPAEIADAAKPRPHLQGAPRRLRRAIDWLALFAVIFGVVASVGQGALQMGAGLRRIGDFGGVSPVLMQTSVIVVLACVYLASAAGGLKRGIEPLSNLNLVLSGALLFFVAVAGPTGAILETATQSLSAYAAQIVPLSVDLRPEGPARAWTRDWTLTYLLWWVAWTPFVGVFIARISRGRTVREFVLGVVLVPTLLTWAWFSAFGGAALTAQFDAGVDLGVTDFATAPAAAYALLDTYAFTVATQALTVLLVFVFLITSADSGAYVLAMLSNGGDGEPPVAERLFWGVLIAILSAAALASGSGQNATRAFAVVGAIPLCILLAAQIAAVSRRLWRDGLG